MSKRLPEYWLGKFVTAQPIDTLSPRQGWIESLQVPYAVTGQTGETYLCAGFPSEVVNPPERPKEFDHGKD